MNGENDLIYHEPLPRVLLIDFQQWDTEIFEKSDINFKIGHRSYSKDQSGSISTYFETEQKSSEIDVVFLYAECAVREEQFARTFSADSFSIGRWQFVNFLVLQRNGFFVCFVGNNSAESIHRFFPEIDVYNTNFKIKQTPHKFINEFANNPFCNFVKTNFENAKGYYALSNKKDSVRGGFYYKLRPLLVDDVGHQYVVQLDRILPTGKMQPFAIFLPAYKDTPSQVLYILEKILPRINPNLFPNVADFSYLCLDEFLPRELIELKKEREKFEKGYQEEMMKYQEKKEKIRNEKGYLTDLLAQKHDILKQSCRRVLQEIMKMAGSDVRVIDVDIEDDMKDVDRRLKDDLRIKLPDHKIILIDVKGTDKVFGQPPLNQLSEHRRIFQKHHKDHNVEDIHSLGFLNHQLSVNPKNRDEIFGSYTLDAIERIKSDEFTIIGTYELFKLHKALSEKEVSANEQQVLYFLTNTGINTFEQFFKTNQ
jgi:hypothetical protein